MFAKLKARLFRAFGDWVIQRAMRTPYTHIFHDDGRPYMERFWMLRINLPEWLSNTKYKAATLEIEAFCNDRDGEFAKADALRAEALQLRDNPYPWFGIRIHHIQSGDDRVFHDHPWPFSTLILRGGYNEITPFVCHDGKVLPGAFRNRRFTAGSFRRVRANQWHYLTMAPGEDAWTLFITGRKRQGWGFLVNGVKVPWRQYLAERASKAGMA